MKKVLTIMAIWGILLSCVVVLAADKVVVVPLVKGPYIGRQDITPSTSNQTITKGYHDGTGTVAGDINLAPENIKTGVSIFGIGGTYTCPTMACGTESVPYCWTGITAPPPPPDLYTRYSFECLFEMQDCLNASNTQQVCDEYQAACVIVYTGGIQPIP